jgi:hypothetical protein
MALTISIEGKGVIANCDAETNDTGGTGTGDWTEQGGGTMSLSTDVFLVGSSCISGQYASKDGFQQFDIGAGNELDFTAGTGSEAGEMLYMWVSMSALGTLDTLSTYPLCIRLSSDSPGTSNYIDYLIAGNDDTNGWAGGFKCFIIDPTKTASRVSGTQSSIIASVRTLGVWIDCSGSARADSIFIDQIAVGSGLRVTGTSTTGWKDIVDYCTAYSSRGWGMFQEREGIYYAYGKTNIGDATTPQASAVSFTDSGRVIQYGISEYCTNAATGTWASSVPTTFSGIVIEDDSAPTTGVTTFSDGIIVGTDAGRSGTSFIGNSSMNVSMDLYGGNNTSSVTTLYGTSLKTITGAINSGNDAQHKFLSVSMAACDQFDPVGAPVIRNCTFAETSSVDSALLWNSSIDVQNCKFIANTLGAGIEHDVASSYTYTDLTFSGNTYDVLNSIAGTVNISVSGTGAASSAENTGGGSTNFLSSVDMDIQVEDTGGVDIQHAQVYIQKSATGKQWNYTSHATNNAAGDATFEVVEVVDTDLPQSGWLHVWDASSNTKQNYRYASWTGKIFTFYAEVTFACTGGGTGVLLQDSGHDFTVLEIEEGDTVRNTTDGSWATVDEITDASNITTTELQGGSDNTWTSGDTYSFHKLAILYNANDKVDIPLFNNQTGASGDTSGSYNWGAIGAILPIKVRIRSNQGGTKYLPYNTSGQITGDGYSLTAVLSKDDVAT